MSSQLYHLDCEYDPGGPPCPAGFLLLTVTSENQRELGRSKTGVRAICSKQSDWFLSLTPHSFVHGSSGGKKRERWRRKMGGGKGRKRVFPISRLTRLNNNRSSRKRGLLKLHVQWSPLHPNDNLVPSHRLLMDSILTMMV